VESITIANRPYPNINRRPSLYIGVKLVLLV